MANPVSSPSESATNTPPSTTGPQTIEVIDSRGRKILLKEPSFYDKSVGIYTLVGPELSKNDAYLGAVRVLMYVLSIDETPTLSLSTDRNIQDLTNDLGEEGMEAVLKGIEEHFVKLIPRETVEKK